MLILDRDELVERMANIVKGWSAGPEVLQRFRTDSCSEIMREIVRALRGEIAKKDEHIPLLGALALFAGHCPMVAEALASNDGLPLIVQCYIGAARDDKRLWDKCEDVVAVVLAKPTWYGPEDADARYGWLLFHDALWHQRHMLVQPSTLTKDLVSAGLFIRSGLMMADRSLSDPIQRLAPVNEQSDYGTPLAALVFARLIANLATFIKPHVFAEPPPQINSDTAAQLSAYRTNTSDILHTVCANRAHYSVDQQWQHMAHLDVQELEMVISAFDKVFQAGTAVLNDPKHVLRDTDIALLADVADTLASLMFTPGLLYSHRPQLPSRPNAAQLRFIELCRTAGIDIDVVELLKSFGSAEANGRLHLEGETEPEMDRTHQLARTRRALSVRSMHLSASHMAQTCLWRLLQTAWNNKSTSQIARIADAGLLAAIESDSQPLLKDAIAEYERVVRMVDERYKNEPSLDPFFNYTRYEWLATGELSQSVAGYARGNPFEHGSVMLNLLHVTNAAATLPGVGKALLSPTTARSDLRKAFRRRERSASTEPQNEQIKNSLIALAKTLNVDLNGVDDVPKASRCASAFCKSVEMAKLECARCRRVRYVRPGLNSTDASSVIAAVKSRPSLSLLF